MGIPFEVPPVFNGVLTLTAMLGLFAYFCRLAGKDDRQMHVLDEIKRMNSDTKVTPHERSAGSPHAPIPILVC